MCEFFEIDDEIISIEYVGDQETLDINVNGNRLFYANNILTHNSAQDEVEFNHAHISGGLSKIQTADNVFAINTNKAMRDRGKYELQFMKTRNSSGVGQKITLDFDVETLRITNGDDDDDDYASTSTSQKLINSMSRTSVVTPATSETTQDDIHIKKSKVEQNTSALRGLISRRESTSEIDPDEYF